MRPIWNGAITFGLVVIPVRLYAATERKEVTFHQLHAACNTPVRYLKWCPHCQKELTPYDIARAYEYRKGEYVVLTDEELESIPGPRAHMIEIMDFVRLSEVDPVYYEKSFFLEPQEGAEKAYYLLFSAMRESGKVAVARVAIRAKETLALLRSYSDRLLMLETMYWADEVRSGAELAAPAEIPLNEREMAMAENLIETLSTEFDPARYRSVQREALASLIERKIQGREVILRPERQPAQVIDLMEALRRSIEEVTKERSTPTGRAGRRGRKKAAGEGP